MGRKAGELLWNRMHITMDIGVATVDVDTGIRQVNQAFPNMSPNEPTMGTRGAAAPAPGTLPASRIMVIPMLPRASWIGTNITGHSEPYVNTTTGNIHVTFTRGATVAPLTFNVLFWDPHSLLGPGDADTYNAP